MILTFFFPGMATMKENKGKEVVDEVTRPEAQSQPHPSIVDKRKKLIQDARFGKLIGQKRINPL